MKVIISGGGTGGHIFPAIAIANAIKAEKPNANILFVGAEGRMEMEKVPQAGYPIVGLTVVGFKRQLSFKNLIFPFKLWKSLRKAKKIIRDFKPDLVVGVGGYASGPTLRCAGKMNIPCLIQEQNSYAGLTNRLLAKSVRKVCVAYENMDRFFPAEKIVITGNPVRQDIVILKADRQMGLEKFELSPDRPCILVVGGSLGARTINETMLESSTKLVDHGFQIVWQTGKNFDLASAEAKGFGPHVKVLPFINRMDLAYAAADFIVSRAGAISISELCVIGKPTILIPSPMVTEDHQTKNALAIVEKNAGILLADKDCRSLLAETIIELKEQTERQKTMSENIRKLARPDAAHKIALEALSLIPQSYVTR